MTAMGSVFGRKSSRSNPAANIPAFSQSMPPVDVCRAPCRIVTPAEAIKAITAGRSPLSAPWIRSRLRYFKYSFANRSATAHEGNTQPSVATKAPEIPAMRMPTNVAELMAMGPGVIWEMVMISANSLMFSHPCSSTTCAWISGMAA